MHDVTQMLESIEQGNSQAARELMPLVYEELKRLASHHLRGESPGHTLQATALVHEAYLRLVKPGQSERAWQNRQHFFAVAAEAMRLILIDEARRKKTVKYGGGRRHQTIMEHDQALSIDLDSVLEMDEALQKLQAEDPSAAQMVKLRFYGGMELEEIAQAMNISRATVVRNWQYARAWLISELGPMENH